MKKQVAQLMSSAKSLSEPENFFSGQRLPEGFSLPDNILMFFHNFTTPTSQSHGRCTLVFPFDDMIYYVDRKQFFLTPGVVLFVPPYATRFLHLNSAGYRRLFITFDDPLHQHYLPEAGMYRIADDMWKILQDFIKCYRNNITEDSSIILMQFLRSLKTTHGEQEESHSLNKHITKAVEYIENNLKRGIGLVDIAEHAGLSESHLRMLFRKEMGISPGRYIAQKRLDMAKYRLLHSTMRLNEIAAECGFSNLFVFSAFFKKQIGISPLQFRKNADPE